MFTIITGGRNSGKTTYLKNLVARKTRVFGYISEKVYGEQGVVGYSLVNSQHDTCHLHIHETQGFARQFTNKRFNFNLDAYDICCHQLTDAMKNYEHLYIDELGALEMKKHIGFYPILETLAKSDLHVYITIRSELLASFLELLQAYNHEYEVIKLKSVGAVLLASGDSNRFGNGNKLLAPWKSHTLFEEVLTNVIKSGCFSHILVVSKYEDIKVIADQYEAVNYIHNPDSHEGISASIRLGTKYLQDKVDGYMFIPGDQVGIQPTTFHTISQYFKDHAHQAIVPRYDGQAGSPKLLSSSLTAELLTLAGDKGARSIIGPYHDVAMIDISDTKQLYDIDTSDDLITAKDLLREDGGYD